MQRPLHKFFICLFLTFLTVSGCQQHENFDEPHLNKEVIDLSKVHRYFGQCSSEEKLQLIKKLYKKSHKNQAQIDAWFQKNVIAKYSSFEFSEPKILKSTLLTVYRTENSELSAQFAQQITSDKREQIASVKPSAHAIVLYNCDLLQQKDSVQKYLHLLGKYLKYDPSSWLRVSYLIHKATVELKAGRNLEALNGYTEALKYTNRAEVKNQIIIHLNLALLYLKFDAVDKARYHIRQVRSFGVQKFPTDLLNSIGIVLSKTKEFSLAEVTFKRALAIADQTKIPVLKAQTLANFANHRRRERRFSEALELMKQSDSICKREGVMMGLYINQLNRSELFLDQGTFSLLEKELDLLKPQVFEVGDPGYIIDYYRMRYKLYDAIGKKELANVFFRKHQNLLDAKMGDRARSLLIEWELARIEIEQGKERLRYHMVLQKQKYTKLIFGLAFAVLLFGASIVFIIYSRRMSRRRFAQKQIQQRMAFDLELKSKELMIESLKNSSIQQLKQDINTALSAILDKLPAVHRDKFDELRRLLKIAPSNPFLDEFESRFKAIYEEFYIKLKQLAPDLTPHEVKICALLRLNISSKEIASLTNRTPGTIDNTRSIIRRKLNLDDHINLQDFILDL